MTATAEARKYFRNARWRSWGVAECSSRYPLREDLGAIEVEVENDQHSEHYMQDVICGTTDPQWVMVAEGSLRGGYELVSSAPIPIPDLKESLEQVEQAFDGANDTFRAAIHHHRNVQYFTREQYMRAVIAYYILEPSFYSFSGSGRDESVFCVPWYKGIRNVHMLAQAYHEVNCDAWGTAIRTSPKYSGLNLRATTTYGSIEFRHLPTPALSPAASRRRIEEYIDMCSEVIELATAELPEGTSMLEFADHVLSRHGDIPIEHMCNVYSALAVERPIDRLESGMSSATVMRAVDTHALGRRRQRVTLANARRRQPRNRYPSTRVYNSTRVEVEPVDRPDMEPEVPAEPQPLVWHMSPVDFDAIYERTLADLQIHDLMTEEQD